MADELLPVRELVSEVDRLRRRVKRSERSADLRYAAIDGGRGVVITNPETGEEVATLGMGADGTPGLTYANGAEPAEPHPVAWSVAAGVLTVFSNGQTVEGPFPGDFKELEIHADLTEDFEPTEATRLGVITTPTGSLATTIAPGLWQVRAMLHTTSGLASPPSVVVEVEVPDVTDNEGLQAELLAVQENLDATVKAQGNRDGLNPPTAADAEGANPGVVFYQRETMPGGPVVGVWRWDGTAWRSMPMKDDVFVSISTDKLVAGTSLIGGVLLEDGAISARHTNSDSFMGKTYQGVLFEGSEMRSGTMIGNNVTGGYMGTANVGKRVYMEGDSLTAKGSDEKTTGIFSPDGIWLTKPGEGLVQLGPHIYGAFESNLRGDFRHTNNLLVGQNTTSDELWAREAADQQAVSDRYKVEVSFTHASGGSWSTDPEHPRAQVVIQAVDSATLQPIANLFARDIRLHGLPAEAAFSFSAFGSGSLGGFKGRFHLRRITTVRSVPAVQFRDFVIHVTPQ